MDYDSHLNRQVEELYSEGDEAEGFHEYMEREYLSLNQKYEGHDLYHDDGDIFYVEETGVWVDRGEDSYWDFNTTELEACDLVEVILVLSKKNGESK